MENDRAVLIDCFANKIIKANPKKCQDVAIDNTYENEDNTFNLDGNNIYVTLW